jgi:hypothetical protein
MGRAEDLTEITTGMAKLIDEALNPEGRTTGFLLAVFDFGEAGLPVTFASNANRENLKATLHELAKQVEKVGLAPKPTIREAATRLLTLLDSYPGDAEEAAKAWPKLGEEIEDADTQLRELLGLPLGDDWTIEKTIPEIPS